MMNYTNCGLKAAIQMASTNSAELFSLNKIGKIEPGKRADIIQFALVDGEMVIHKTFVAGELVYSKR
jgi:N-acetylglucosamine-6-phosphate deacetylase